MKRIMFKSYRFALGSVMTDNRKRVFVERIQTFANGLDVVIGATRRQTATQQSLGHGLVADVEVDDEGTGTDFLLKSDALVHLTRIPINQVALGALQFGQHGLLQQVQHYVLVAIL